MTRAERIDELERSLAEAVALQVARAELEESLARERDVALAGLDGARDHDDALARERRRQDAVRCAHDDELAELQGAAAARERKAAAHRMKMVSSARRSGASFCFMVLRRWRRARVSKAWRSWADATRAPPRRARQGGAIYTTPSTSASGRRVEYMGSRGPRPRGEAAARLGDAPQSPGIGVGAGPVATASGGTAAAKHGPGGARQAPGIKRLGPVAAPRHRKEAAKHRPRGAREEARFEYCGALAAARGGDGADEERGAAARAVPARVAAAGPTALSESGAAP